jgi:BirA family biotin operon repressor/biotin-[acetyl-CoA-carboxylase] ligase
VTGFTPAAVPDDISEALGARADRLAGFVRRFLYFETVSSTNDIADRLAGDGAAHGTVVAAEAQESGRGRMGRTWFSPPGAGLYVSVVLRPQSLGDPAASSDVSLPSSVSLTAGVALAEAIQVASGLPVAIKWPNDLVIERRKLCGILAEASSTPEHTLQHVVLGYGINVRPAAYPPDIAHRATSLESELGKPVDRSAVLAETLTRFAEWLRDVGNAGFGRMLQRWRTLSPSSVGSPVEVVQPGGWVAGTTAGIDADGALLVEIEGRVRRVIAGEVRWL